MKEYEPYFTGMSIGYEVPDSMLANDNSYRTCYPSLYSVSCSTGWYNVGGYNGTNGYVKGIYFHTYTDKVITISPSFSISSIDFTVSGEEKSNLDVAWADGTLSPL